MDLGHCWSVEYRRQLIGYEFQIRKIDLNSDLPSAFTVHGDGCWALTEAGVKNKARKILNGLTNERPWKELNNG